MYDNMIYTSVSLKAMENQGVGKFHGRSEGSEEEGFLAGLCHFWSQQQDPNLLGRSDFLESMRMLCY